MHDASFDVRSVLNLNKQLAAADGNMVLEGARARQSKAFFQKLLIYALLLCGTIIMILPFLWMISASLKPNNDVFEFPIRWIPKVIQWDNYVDIWKKIDFLLYYKNTIWLTLVVMFNSLVTSSLAAYAFAKIPFPERKALFLLYVMTMAVPFQVIMIPQFVILKNLGLNDTLWSLVLLQSFSPLGVFLIRQAFMGIPNELSESARIDGLSEFGIYSRIMLPLSKPALSTFAIFQFVFVWNDFLGPLIYLTSDRNKTIQLGIRKFITQYGVEYGLVMAASVCALLPVIVMYVIFQKSFIQGIATTGLKG
ncbi:carbohydrate ABC transporter membrane protein 2 (CUT1 family) [Hydrogenispora ethanolica]|uniref:Carbohydrate ABC transporter membrane protein 2 (CUT1 family) n=2 Tax=Hydrogenispora ethanolica TaxID=1082276 RepID=A0A4R1RVW5_HYDET|nr:carbohydrate ABC transporter membrane protein 2 (CUT1 family) [Hydrogenispora ethanolica]